MTRTPKNPNVERVAGIPFDKDAVSPMPQIVPRRPDRGGGDRTEPTAGREERIERVPAPGPDGVKGVTDGRA